MAIVGIGTDIVDIERFQGKTGNSLERLIARVLTPTEIQIFQQSAQPERYLAKRFAAKEAVAKALGTGIGRGVSFQHIEISNNQVGAPLCHLSDGALERLHAIGGRQIHLSISDEKRYASAFAVAES
ncbi:holo-ACP synthase [Paraferrimonas haliotis]|uniref:Holo-[acyl-carrier-protein] synthase n=1 Tax=Paraferrimonas haliotis TaxID=2013866 RepID=A0AA37WVG0_9GAMM|nr:holo-ACP synthase [Paraferrimonas haliotis]GLS82518.1 holo-[acyl-carrier-protein] synthase [Paraferrimonas haliotis]